MYSLTLEGNSVQQLVANLKAAIEAIESENNTHQTCIYGGISRDFHIISIHPDKSKIGVLEIYNDRDGRHPQPQFKWYRIMMMSEIV